MNHRLPGSTGANKTIHREKNQARIVITVEVELADAQMKAAPKYLTDAVHILREADYKAQIELSKDLADALEPLGITVLSHKTEIAP
jgi:hypothetical protein